MNKRDLGYHPKTGYHSKILTNTESRFLAVLWIDYSGADEKISAAEMAVRFDCALNGFEPDIKTIPAMIKRATKRKKIESLKREVRRMQLHLLRMHDNIPILSKAGNGGGYWIAADETEAAAFYETFKKRGLTGLVKASRGKKSILVDLVKQLSFEFEELIDCSSHVKKQEHQIKKPAEPSAPMAIVDAFLEKMLKNPERFSGDLEKISRKFGSVLLPKARVKEMQQKAVELQDLVRGLV